MYHLNRLIKLRVDVNLSNINYLKDFIQNYMVLQKKGILN